MRGLCRRIGLLADKIQAVLKLSGRGDQRRRVHRGLGGQDDHILRPLSGRRCDIQQGRRPVADLVRGLRDRHHHGADLAVESAREHFQSFRPLRHEAGPQTFGIGNGGVLPCLLPLLSMRPKRSAGANCSTAKYDEHAGQADQDQQVDA